MSTFNNGDVVCLKSGGAKMTVTTGIPADPTVMVATVWHDVNGAIYRDVFHPDQLVKAEFHAPHELVRVA